MRRLAPGATCVNFYGATETPQAVAWHRIGESEAGGIPLGHGIAGVQLLVLNAAGLLCGIGELGEINVRTPYLSRGYVDDPGLTAERFRSNSFTDNADDRIYRTGDLGRYRPDGAVAFCGRRDRQVKVRGFRVELGDIETALRAQPDVREAAALLHTDEGHDPRLVGYVVLSDPRPDVEAIARVRQSLRQRLPDYMVPSQLVVVERLPRSPNGKVDRRALPAPTMERSQAQSLPRTRTEEQIAKIWRDVLGVESVAIDENFFELGGHSLMATRMMARLRSAVGVELPLRVLFETPTITGLAERIDHGRTHACSDVAGSADWKCLVPVQPRGTRAPLFLVVGYTNADETMLIPSRLIPHLDPERPLYGLRPRYLNGVEHLYRSVQEMARECLEEIRTVQPRGPYLLGGYCIAASVALEIAQQLARQGETIKLLAMIDALRPCAMRAFLSRLRHASDRGRHMVDVIGQLMRLDSRTRASLVRRLARRTFRRADARDELSTEERVYQSRRHYVRLLHGYRPKAYDGEITLIVSEEFYRLDRYMGWAGVATGGVTLHRLPGDHETLLTRHSKELARLLREHMESS
jgi:thioesterase domain-containing protein/acyl carrier protein